MKENSRILTIANLDEEIQTYIKRRKDENSALKKLITALENAKKNAGKRNTV